MRASDIEETYTTENTLTHRCIPAYWRQLHAPWMLAGHSCASRHHHRIASPSRDPTTHPRIPLGRRAAVRYIFIIRDLQPQPSRCRFCRLEGERRSPSRSPSWSISRSGSPSPRSCPQMPGAEPGRGCSPKIVNSGIQPFQNNVRNHLCQGHPGRRRARPLPATSSVAGLAALEQIAVETAAPFLVGAQPSFADVCLVPRCSLPGASGSNLAGCLPLLAAEASLRGPAGVRGRPAEPSPIALPAEPYCRKDAVTGGRSPLGFRARPPRPRIPPGPVVEHQRAMGGQHRVEAARLSTVAPR